MGPVPSDEPAINLDRAGDVLELGPPPGRPAPWRRWALPALVAAILVTAGVAYTRRDDQPTAAPTATASSPAPTASAVPAVSGPVITFAGPGLLGVRAGWELFGWTGSEVVRVQLAAGQITRTPVPPLGSSGPVSFLALPDGVLIRPLDRVAGYRVRDNTPAATLTGALARSGPVLPGPRPGTVWTSQDQDGGPRAVALVDADGNPVGEPLSPPDRFDGFPVADGSGNVLVLGIGGIYQLGPHGAQRITTGDLVAVGPTRWLVEECDERARCSLVVVNKQTGARRTLPEPPTFNTPGIISPDGRIAAIYDATSALFLLDLTTGAVRRVPGAVSPSYGGGSAVWSPDSRLLFAVGQGGVLLVIQVPGDKGLDASPPLHTVDIGVTLPALQLLAIRA